MLPVVSAVVPVPARFGGQRAVDGQGLRQFLQRHLALHLGEFTVVGQQRARLDTLQTQPADLHGGVGGGAGQRARQGRGQQPQRGTAAAVHHADVEHTVRQIGAAARRQTHPVIGAVAREQQPQRVPAAADLGLQRMPVRAHHAQHRQQPGGPSADPRRPVLPHPHQLRIHAQAQRVEEHALPRTAAEPPHVDPHALPVPDRLREVARVLHTEVVGEVVERAARQHRQRQSVPQCRRRGRVHRAVPAADAEHRGSGGRLVQFGAHVLGAALHDLRRGQRVRQRADPLGGPRRGVDHQHQTRAVRQHRELCAGPGGRCHLGAGRHHAPYREGRAHPQRRTRHDIAREVHAGVDPGRRHRERDRRHHRAPRRGLQRDPGREGRRGRGVTGRERRGDRLACQMPGGRDMVQQRPGTADRPLAERVDGEGRQGQRGETAGGRPAGAGGADRAHRGRRGEPQLPVAGAAAQPWQHRPGTRPVVLGGQPEEPAVQGEQPVAQRVPAGLRGGEVDV